MALPQTPLLGELAAAFPGTPTEVSLRLHSCDSRVFAVVHSEMRETERMINDISDDVMRDVMTSVTSQESRRLAADFHVTYVVRRLDMLHRCSDAVKTSRVRSYFNVWKTRLSGKHCLHFFI